MTPVKVCGLTRLEDARLAWECGASALGFIFHPASPRAVTPRQARDIRRALPREAFCIGVFVDVDPDRINAVADAAGLDAVQLHGHELPETCTTIRVPVIKAIRVADEASLERYHVAAFLLDATHPTKPGGTGLRADWELAARLARRSPLILAGGLDPDNVLEAIERVRPAGVDVCSGVEASPGTKDPALLRALLAQTTLKGDRPCLLPR